ncbi:hypothetical protein Nepgr_009363 [Nepenthes gracilis]|uniref:Uncharacterized protein n=1 Tax=Nepenthes gracilis TaxID=150966 RepID=A0AAD3SAH0_NEPGR|nr:hypothetical protein Nepgr_009363 [Nepenthes gracilis]
MKSAILLHYLQWFRHRKQGRDKQCMDSWNSQQLTLVAHPGPRFHKSKSPQSIGHLQQIPFTQLQLPTAASGATSGAAKHAEPPTSGATAHQHQQDRYFRVHVLINSKALPMSNQQFNPSHIKDNAASAT